MTSDGTSSRERPANAAQSRAERLLRSGTFLAFCAWTFLGLLETTNAYVGSQLRGLPGGWAAWLYALIGNMPWWYFWAALTPVVVMLARRFRFDGDHPLRAAAVHVLAAGLLAIVHLSVTGIVYWTTHGRASPQIDSATAQIRLFIQNYAMLDVVTYAAIIGAVYAVDFYRRYRAEEVMTARLGMRAAQLESSMNQARLDALRMELNPHFLFNTLNAISGLVRRGENDAAVSMLARLGDLLRVTLERDSAHEVPLETELEVLRGYLEIERIRFHDRLTIDLDIAQETLCALVPTLILQPLVENAIRHGIAPRPGPGRVTISTHGENGHLRIVVSDTGNGFSQSGTGDRRGVGLTNTASRLEQFYGQDAQLDLGSNPGGGAAVSVTLPFRTGGEEGESNGNA